MYMDVLYWDFHRQFAEIPTIEVVDEQKSKRMKIRSRTLKYEGEYLQFVIEREEIGTVPEQFISLIKKMEGFSAFNKPRIEKYDMIETELALDGSEIEIYAALGRKITIVSPIIQFDTKYFFPSENLFIISSRGNEDV
jgi:hypothetical protein